MTAPEQTRPHQTEAITRRDRGAPLLGEIAWRDRGARSRGDGESFGPLHKPIASDGGLSRSLRRCLAGDSEIFDDANSP